jgi:glutaconate CoA-transferase subunit A
VDAHPRGLVDHVVEAPRGAAFTSCDPDYPRDEEAQRAYAASAAEPGGWAAFSARYLASPDALFRGPSPEGDGGSR